MHRKPGVGLVVALYGAQERLVLNAQALDGLFFAARREVFDSVRFDDSNFDGWHFYDIDFTYSAFQAGMLLGVRTDLLLMHESAGSFDADYLHYAERFAHKHGIPLPGKDVPEGEFLSVPMKSEADWLMLTRYLYE